MRFLVFIFIIGIASLTSCDSNKYSEEDENKLVEAQRLHNESLAIFSKTLPLLADLTEIRSNISKSLGMPQGDTTSSGGTETDSANVNNQKAQQKTDTMDSANENANAKKEQPGQDIAETPSDTTGAGNKMNAMEKMNQAQIDLLTWMRNIYLVPDMKGIYDKEKAANAAIGADQQSVMLKTDMEFKTLPEGASVEEIYEKQKEMHEEITRINEELKKAIEEGKSVD